MLLFWVILLLIAVVISGDIFLRGAIGVAKTFKIPPFILGATLIAMGTSSPDIFFSITSSLQDFHNISVAALVSSSIVNILIGIGASALFGTILYDKKDYIIRFGMLYATVFIICFILGLIVFQGKIGMLFSITLLSASILFIIINIAFIPKEERLQEVNFYNPNKFLLAILFGVIGLIGLTVFSELLLKFVLKASDELLIPKKVIASGIIGLGNSLPEIITSILAVIRRQSRVVIGNIMGSNIFAIGSLLGITGIINNLKTGSAMEIALPILVLDIPFLLFSSLLIFICFKIKNSISKITGLIFIFIYLLYTLLQFNII